MQSPESRTSLTPAAVSAAVLLFLFGFGCADDFREASMVSYAVGDSCLARGQEAALSGGAIDDAQVEITVDGLRIHVAHKNAIFNCCLDTIVVGFSQDGRLLTLREAEVTNTPCHCICPFEVTATIEVLLGGEYVVEIYTRVELVWRDKITV